VVVSSTGGSIITTQRVVFAQSFSEIPASVPPATAAPLYLNWYDTTSWGFTGDNVHVVNTGTTAADVSVSVAGQTHTLTGLGAGGGTYTSFPGVVAGPVVISSTQPLVASQRFLYHGELIEQSAAPAAAATTPPHRRQLVRPAPLGIPGESAGFGDGRHHRPPRAADPGRALRDLRQVLPVRVHLPLAVRQPVLVSERLDELGDGIHPGGVLPARRPLANLVWPRLELWGRNPRLRQHPARPDGVPLRLGPDRGCGRR